MSGVRRRLEAFRQKQRQRGEGGAAASAAVIQGEEGENGGTKVAHAGGYGSVGSMGVQHTTHEERIAPEDVTFSTTRKRREQGGKDSGGDGSGTEGPQFVKVRRLTWFDVALRVMAYVLLQYVFWVLGFGLAFFLVAAFYFLYASTTSAPRRKGEKSAYARFNEESERIHGDVDPETMVRQLGAAGAL